MKLANALKRCFKRSDSGFATETDVRSLLKAPKSGGVVIGGYDGKPIIYGGDDNVIVVAGGTRPMIGVGLVAPTLMTYRGSVVVHDFRGDLYRQTAERREAMGQKVIRFAPGEVETVSSDFSVTDLQNGDTPVTLYLVSDPANPKQVSPVHRALLSTIIQSRLSAAIRYQDGHMIPSYRHKLLLLLDEYTCFDGRVPGLSEGIPFMADYGIQSYITVRNAEQLEDLCTIVANSHIRIFLPSPGINIKTAEYMSKMLGTVESRPGIRKPLMPVDDVFRQRREQCLTLRAGHAPIFGALVPCWDPLWKRM